MAKEDEEKTAFHTSQGVYCYTTMSFGLKNARETYQRLVDKAFKKQIGRNLEVYVDDMVINSHTEQKNPRHRRNFPNPEEDKHKTKPQEMHLRCRRRDVPRPCCQHEGNQGMSGKGRSSDKATVPKNAEGSAKPQRKARKPE
ncbi:hypothetical protein Tco_1120893 [Tanacetum coccineum]|uniref:Reverse transcriptase domain-containing protein n=1 Tax=Tanacetum coccineum TaxID=301880 RepID=A0ABQ5IW71_9ASTR